MNIPVRSSSLLRILKEYLDGVEYEKMAVKLKLTTIVRWKPTQSWISHLNMV
jgi:hypothetical protein